MKTGFVIVNFNSWEMTEALAKKAASFENIDAVVVVDNASTDGSYEKLKNIRNDKIQVAHSGKNGGYSFGNNYGAAICRKLGIEILFISNPDVAVEEEDIEKILVQFEDDAYSMLSGVEYCTEREMSRPPLWRQNRYMDDLTECFFLGRKLRRKHSGIELDEKAAVQEAELIKGSFFAVRLEDFLRVGGFDEHMFLYCEERVISSKIAGIGKKIGIVTGARYIHNHTASIGREYKKASHRMRLLYVSRLYYNKNYNQIGSVKYGLLWCAMKLSIFEFCVRDFICSIK